MEQESLFIEMQANVQFRQQICLIHNYYQQANARRRSHPYRRPHDTNSSTLSSNSAQSMREVMILDMEAQVPASPSSSSSSHPCRNASPRFTAAASDALLTPLAPSPPSPTPTSSSSSYRSATSRSLLLGTQENPIVIEENHKDILVCA